MTNTPRRTSATAPRPATRDGDDLAEARAWVASQLRFERALGCLRRRAALERGDQV